MLRNEIDMMMGGCGFHQMPYVQQYDVKSRIFACKLWRDEGVPFTLADNAVVGAVFKWRRSQGSHEYETVIENPCTVIVTVPAEAMQLEGKVEMQLKIHQNGGELNGPVVTFVALRSLKPSDTETDEPVPMLVALVDQTQELLTQIRTELENGEFDGKDGVSPNVTLTRVDGGIRIDVANENTGYSETVYDGKDGEPGPRGETGVFFGNDEPDDPEVMVWIDSSGGADEFEAYGIPTLQLTGDITGMSKDNAVTLHAVLKNKNNQLEVTDTVTCKWQGSSSLYYPKKNYTIKFNAEFEAKSGWGVHNKYCLKANWVDASNIRNLLGANLWGKMVKLRTDITDPRKDLPNGGAIDGFPVWVMINGESAGLYTMNIPKDAWMLGMTGSNSAEGFICAENYKCDTAAVGDETDIEIEYAAGDKAELLASFNNMISVLNSVASADDLPALEAVLDMGSVADYYAHCCFTNNHDGMTKNYILATYDGVKWFMSAYDMDATFGNYWDGSGHGWANDYPSFSDLGTGSGKNKLFSVAWKYYAEQIKASYQNRRYWEFGEIDLTNAVYTLAHQFPRVLVNEDYRLWPTRPATMTSCAEQILTYARIRGSALDWDIKSNT